MNKNEDADLLEEEFEPTEETETEETQEQKIKDLREKLKQKIEESKINLDGWQRARAEMANKDKQINSERLEIYKTANQDLLEKVIPVLDSYYMARKNRETWEKVDSNWRVGVEYIFTLLENAVQGAGLEIYSPKIGDKFEVKTMHAMEEIETDDESKDNTVADLVQTGFTLNGKLLREAKVKILVKK